MTLQLRCADLGLSCSGTVEGDTSEELLAKVTDHARDKHGVELNQTLIDYALEEVETV